MVLNKVADQRLKMEDSQVRLIACHQQCAGGQGGKLLHGTEACLDGTGDSLLPHAIDDLCCRREFDGLADALGVCAKDGQDWHRSCFGSSADGARKQGLTVELEKLLGLAEAAAGSRCKHDSAN